MMKKQYGDSSRVVMGVEPLLYEILSRLPAKSLMRFKCVCKQWQSLIHKDGSFMDLHFKRSKTLCNFSVGGGGISLIMRWPKWHSHKFGVSSVELLLSKRRVATAQREREVPISGAASSFPFVFGAVNGLISLVNRSANSVSILNPSTGQSTSWIQSMIKQQHQNLYEKIQVIDEDGHCVSRQIQYVNSNWYYFGYDPLTMEHKVVLFWIKEIYDRLGVFLRSENICEVMTVDGRQHNKNNLSWRRIDDEFVLPPTISPSEFTSSVYANGSIYWLRNDRKQHSVTEPLIVEFNVGSEKFRVISIPKYIIKQIRYPFYYKLIQIDGRLSVLATATTCITDTPSMKMCVLYDKKLKDIISSISSSVAGSTVSNSGDFYWIQETFMMPHSDWGLLEFDTIQAVPGTDLLIMRSEGHAGSTFYFYDWRKKSFNKESFFIAETSSFEYFVYKESLLPVI
ncbi:putative F-box protein At5g52610 [Papaver somniferum]|uniref:putative F-box protein At5g52610 n=1 Tax=Papaver somniferum TaxID=3469 RepID=UPI000E6FF124|nr:putative F-box protein At5g52610 [Papaver somniferum]